MIVPSPAPPPKRTGGVALGSEVTQRLSPVSALLWPPACFKKRGNIEVLVAMVTQQCLQHLLVLFFKFLKSGGLSCLVQHRDLSRAVAALPVRGLWPEELGELLVRLRISRLLYLGNVRLS